jgi:hypothetical protein
MGTLDAGYEYIRDDARRRIRINVRDALTGADIIALVDRQASEGTWSYGVLYDMRAVKGAPPSNVETRAVADHVWTRVARYGPRGPVAIVTRAVDMVAVGHMYGYLLGTTVPFELETFRELDAAERWLDQQAANP